MAYIRFQITIEVPDDEVYNVKFDNMLNLMEDVANRENCNIDDSYWEEI